MPTPVAEPKHAPAPVAAPIGKGLGMFAVAGGIGFLVLAAGLFFVWHEVAGVERGPDAAWGAAMERQVAGVAQKLGGLEKRVAALEGRPVADVTPLAGRLAALERRPAGSVDTGPLEGRIAALEARPAGAPVDLAPLEARLAAAERAARRLGVALALAEGRPLGALPDAPAALARFATVAPPTLDGLRARFAAAAEVAESASRPVASDDWAGRVRGALGGLMTVRRGDAVLVGPAAAAGLAAARGRLEAGDLAGALAALDGLDPAAAAAMAGWRGEAAALVDARRALAEMK